LNKDPKLRALRLINDCSFEVLRPGKGNKY
jgi:hypothetical protein